MRGLGGRGWEGGRLCVVGKGEMVHVLEAGQDGTCMRIKTRVSFRYGR